MPVPVIDFDNHVLQELPDYHRTPRFISWFFGIIRGSSSRMYSIFTSFMSNSVDLGYWDSAVTYGYEDRVRAGNGIVYESLKINNLNNDVTDINWWFPILDYYIGISEQAQNTCQKLMFERSLNRRFQKYLTDNGFVGYKQPETIDPGVGYLPLSDIFLENVYNEYPSFVSFPTELDSSNVSIRTSSGFIYPAPVYSSVTLYQFSINIPLSVYNSIGTTNEIRDSVIRNFANKINRAGIIYTIVTY